MYGLHRRAAILSQHYGCFGTNIPREDGPDNDDDVAWLYDEMEVNDEDINNVDVNDDDVVWLYDEMEVNDKDVTDMEEAKHLFEYEISTH